jgi:copper chaperone CopZ
MPVKLLPLLVLLLSGVANALTIEMTVHGLVCGFCAQGIEKRLRKFSQTAEVLVSLENRLVALTLKESTDIADATLREALEKSGYAVIEIRRTETSLGELRERGRPKEP